MVQLHPTQMQCLVLLKLQSTAISMVTARQGAYHPVHELRAISSSIPDLLAEQSIFVKPSEIKECSR